MKRNNENSVPGDRLSPAKAQWTPPVLVDLDGDLDDVESGGGANSDGGGRTTS